MSGGWIWVGATLWGAIVLLWGCSTAPHLELQEPAVSPPGVQFQPTPGAPFEPPPGPDPAPPGGPLGLDRAGSSQPEVVARVAGEPIDKRDLADFICLMEPATARFMTEKLVQFRIIRNEMKRLKVEVSEDQVRAIMARELEKVIQAAKAKNQDLDAFLLDREGETLETFKVLEPIRIRTAMAYDRVLRYTQVLEDRVEGRILVVGSRAEAEEVLEKLEAGADFGALARKVSLHLTHVSGGRLPPLGRWNVEPELEKVFFSLPPGGVSSPIEFKEGDKTRFVILKCIRFHPARRVSFAEVREEIEEGLRNRGVEDMERSGWTLSMVNRYKVDLLLLPPKEQKYVGERIR